jgi:hypothetical protein
MEVGFAVYATEEAYNNKNLEQMCTHNADTLGYINANNLWAQSVYLFLLDLLNGL